MSRRNYHEDTDLFREALSFTQSETGFSARLVEKDYYCSLLLEDLLAVNEPAVGVQGRDLPEQGPQRLLPHERGLGLRLLGPVGRAPSQRSKMIVPMKEHLAKLASGSLASTSSSPFGDTTTQRSTSGV